MPVSFKSKLSSSVINTVFLDKTIDDIKTGKLQLRKSDIDLANIEDVQVYINFIAATSGINGEADPNNNTYSSEEIIANGDDRKVAIGKLDAQVNTNLEGISTNTTNIINNTRTVYANEAIAASGSITKDDNVRNQIRRISGDDAPITVSTTPFGASASTIDGVLIVLRGTDATNTVTITNNDIQYGAILNGDAILGNYDQLELMYDATVERWIEQNRNF